MAAFGKVAAGQYQPGSAGQITCLVSGANSLPIARSGEAAAEIPKDILCRPLEELIICNSNEKEHIANTEQIEYVVS
jgi:hypothetical protein